jgi:phosphoribosylaminoimidazole-succinocarboxamide synthase
MQKQAELYRGKAKTVYSTENPDLLVLEFRNDTSAGDGARIEQFDRKGMVNNKFNHFIMSKLAEAGIPTQMERLLSDTECLVKKLEMVPVECVVRNRAAGSLVKRLGIEEGIELNPPLFDLFLKNDAMHDPMVNESYCETFGWVSKENLATMRELTYKANDVLKSFSTTRVLSWSTSSWSSVCSKARLCWVTNSRRTAAVCGTSKLWTKWTKTASARASAA